MTWRLLGLCALGAAICGGIIGFVASFLIVAVTSPPCPRNAMCDLPGLAGMGLAMFLIPAGAFAAAGLTVRMLRSKVRAP